MTRKLLRHIVTIATGLSLAATMFLGVGWWRRSEDAKWCRQAAASGMVAGHRPFDPDLLDDLRSACTVQRERQRRIFGAVWRSGGSETARCGFELARMQLTSYQDPNAYRAILEGYVIDDVDFDASNREDQDRFVNACLFAGQHEAG